MSLLCSLEESSVHVEKDFSVCLCVCVWVVENSKDGSIRVCFYIHPRSLTLWCRWGVMLVCVTCVWYVKPSWRRGLCTRMAICSSAPCGRARSDAFLIRTASPARVLATRIQPSSVHLYLTNH